MVDGDLQKLDFLQDCSWFEYFYRKQNHNKFIEWKAERIEKNLKNK